MLFSVFSPRTLPAFILVIIGLSGCRRNAGSETPVPEPVTPIASTVTIDRTQKHQQIDGFGFFGAQSVWWDGNRDNLYSQNWADLVIEDLGLTIWRNEYYPPSTPGQTQDADWEKQRPVVEGLARTARENNVDLKMIFTVWSPPADMKCAVERVNNQDTRMPGRPHPGGTKEGGTLDPGRYEDFGNWLADGIQLYRDLGIDVYAISPQNEPLFRQPFNSCFYTAEWYAEMLRNSMPVVKNRFQEIRIFGSENMLEIEAGNDRQYFYHHKLMQDEPARANVDIWAIHGYVDGVNPTSASRMAGLWKVHSDEYTRPAGKPVWMTETSGYFDTWRGSSQRAGALDLGLAIHSALYHGQASAWVWWQGSQQDQINEYCLMQGTRRSKRYYVSKHFYRFIRPGAQQVGVTYTEAEGVFASAYAHEAMGAFTLVLINTNENPVELTLSGADIPDTFDFYQTTAEDNCVKKEPVTKGNIVLPPESIVTLVNGNVFE